MDALRGVIYPTGHSCKDAGGRATLAELVVSEARSESSLYWNVAKVKGYGVRTETAGDGTQRYYLVLPKGVEAPLSHTAAREVAPVKMAANKK